MPGRLLHAKQAELMQVLGAIPESRCKKLPIADAAFTLGVLSAIPELTPTKKQLADRLLSRLTPTWIQHGKPDEAFATLAALWQYDSSSIAGEHLVAALQRLITAELAVGGPYHFEQSTVVATHIYIAHFMRLAAKPLPNVEAFLGKIYRSRFTDAHHNNMRLAYICAQMGKVDGFAAYVERHHLEPAWQTPFGIAIVLRALKDTLPPRRRQQLIKILCATTVDQLDIPTLAVIADILTQHQPPQPTVQTLIDHQQAVIAAARQRFATLSEPLRSSALKALETIEASDSRFEITSSSVLFARTLNIRDTLTTDQHTNLGLGSLFGWIAYTIYDDFIDDEGSPSDLSVANIAMRASLDCFATAFAEHATFNNDVARAFLTMDEANAWEVRHCRFDVSQSTITISALPRYKSVGVLAARSSACTIPPLAVLQALSVGRRRMQFIKIALTQYLVARQLADDLQDWPTDVRKGHASYVVTAILRDMHVKPGAHNLADLTRAMHKTFRRKTLTAVCKRMLRSIARSRGALQKSQLLHAQGEFYTLLDRLESTAMHSLDMHTKSITFYEATKTTGLSFKT